MIRRISQQQFLELIVSRKPGLDPIADNSLVENFKTMVSQVLEPEVVQSRNFMAIYDQAKESMSAIVPRRPESNWVSLFTSVSVSVFIFYVVAPFYFNLAYILHSLCRIKMFYYLKDDLANSERVWLDALHEAVKAIGALLDDRRAGNVKLEPLPSEFDEAELKLKEAELEVRYFHDAMLENF